MLLSLFGPALEAAEITDVNSVSEAGELNVSIMGRGFAWLDTGTHDSLMDAGHYVQLRAATGIKGRLFRKCYRNGWLRRSQVQAIGEQLHKTGYGQYLLKVAQEPEVPDVKSTPLQTSIRREEKKALSKRLFDLVFCF